MKNIFFVDSENVGDSWIELFDYLKGEDIILVFYTDKSPNMSYANLITLKQSPFSLNLSCVKMGLRTLWIFNL